MKRLTLTLSLAAFVAALAWGSTASARHSLHSEPVALRSVSFEYAPQTNLLFGANNGLSAPISTGTFMVPVIAQPRLLDGGHDGDGGHGHHGGDHDSSGGNDSTRGNDSTFGGGNGPDSTFGGDNDSSEHHGDFGSHHGDDDSTNAADSSQGGFGGRDGNDSTNVGDTSRGNCGGGHGGRDSSGFADNDHDTLDCGHHGHNDTTATNDTTYHSMFGGNTHSIIIRNNGGNGLATIYLTNNLTASVKLTSASLALGSNFKLVGTLPSMMKPMTIGAGQRVAFTVQFNASDAMAHSDQLLLATNASQPLSPVVFTGVNQVQASVTTAVPAGVTISMAPNPMSNYTQMNVTGVNAADVAIYDLNGRVVRAQSLTGSAFYFNGASNDGASLAAGSYIVRIDGIATDGTQFTTTRQLVIQK